MQTICAQIKAKGGPDNQQHRYYQQQLQVITVDIRITRLSKLLNDQREILMSNMFQQLVNTMHTNFN